MEIKNISGQIVYNKQIQGVNFRENISELGRGIYLIQLTGNKLIYTQKLIIE